MRRPNTRSARALLAASLLLTAGAARADVAPAAALNPQETAPPASVWVLDKKGAYEHLQSGLVCPRTLAGYDRTEVHLYDGYGLDVSCNYRKADDDITVYITRRSEGGIGDAMASAKAELMQYRADRHPKLISESQASHDGRLWLNALYALDPALHSEIWYADVDGWNLEYRATYPEADGAAMAADLAAFTKTVEASAGAQLGLCAKSPAPERTGKGLLNAKENQESAMMASILGGAEMSAFQEGKGKPEPPTTWCVEWTGEAGGRHFLFWRGVRADGSVDNADQMTWATQGPPPTLEVSVDSTQGLIAATNNEPVRWQANVYEAGRVEIFGYFDERPPREAVSALFVDILDGKAKLVGGYSVKGKTISITTPP